MSSNNLVAPKPFQLVNMPFKAPASLPVNPSSTLALSTSVMQLDPTKDILAQTQQIEA